MNLEEFFAEHQRCALAFSGGVDSAFLLWAASHYGAHVKAFFVKTPFQPQFELADARRLADELAQPLQVLQVDVLQFAPIAANPPRRCYYCKQQIMGTIRRVAAQQGYETLLDGSNASDSAGDRPGMQALEELQVLSPLRLAGLTKGEIRRLSQQAGLFTWDKPAYACLATRFAVNAPLTLAGLQRVERSELFLHSLGFRDFRVRVREDTAILQILAEQWPLALAQRSVILEQLSQDFQWVTLDFTVRKSDG